MKKIIFRKKTDECKRNEITSVINNMRLVNRYQTTVRQLDLQIEQERHRVCSEAKTKYIPNGLIGSIPAHWNCSFDESKVSRTVEN